MIRKPLIIILLDRAQNEEPDNYAMQRIGLKSDLGLFCYVIEKEDE
jgi:hypothetical protein